MSARNVFSGSNSGGSWGISAPLSTRPVGHAAFTLVELLIVVTIIAVLAALVVPRFAGRSQQAKITAAKQEIVGNLGVALDVFEQDMGRYPTAEEGLDVLIRLSGQPDPSWKGPYLKASIVPLDPWGREYRYAYPSTLTDQPSLYDLVSAGPDGQYGNEDDITNYSTEASQRDTRTRSGVHSR